MQRERVGSRAPRSAYAVRPCSSMCHAVALLLLLNGLLVAFVALPVWAQELLVVNYRNRSITVYSRTADGNVAPLRTIAGGNTGLNSPVGLTLDQTNREVLVTNDGGTGSVTVYSRTADGNVTPLRSIVGANTGLNGPRSLALDLTNHELFVANVFGDSITVYSRTADGNVTPLRSIVGANTGLRGPAGLTLDPANNELFVANMFGDSITVYDATANGDVTPLRTIVGATTGLSIPRGLALDSTNFALFVANFGDSITVYNRTADGNVIPLRTIVGASTGLNGSNLLALDLPNHELFVTNWHGDSITIYSRTADGNVAPLRTIAGGNTGLNHPVGLALDLSDTIPDSFSVTDVTNVPLSTLQLSNVITVSGITAPAPIAVSGDSTSEYAINGSPWTNIAGTVNNSDTVQVRHLSAATYSTSVDTTLTIGGVADTFTSTTTPPPAPNIKANGSDGPLTLPVGTDLTVIVALDPGGQTGANADWWVAATSPFGLYWYTLGGWVRSDAPIRVYGGPLFALAPYTVLNTTSLPVGNYTLYFGVDLLMNGILDWGQLHVDSVGVTIQ